MVFSPVDALIRIGRIVMNPAGSSQPRYLHARYVGTCAVKSSPSSYQHARMGGSYGQDLMPQTTTPRTMHPPENRGNRTHKEDMGEREKKIGLVLLFARIDNGRDGTAPDP